MGEVTGLYSVFLEARQGDKRVQWMLFPPSDPLELGSEMPVGRARFMKRRIEREGHRAKWGVTEKPSQPELAVKLKSELDQYESTDWVLMAPIVIRLELDDYQKAWKSTLSTPYKALRHVAKVAAERGYTV